MVLLYAYQIFYCPRMTLCNKTSLVDLILIGASVRRQKHIIWCKWFPIKFRSLKCVHSEVMKQCTKINQLHKFKLKKAQSPTLGRITAVSATSTSRTFLSWREQKWNLLSVCLLSPTHHLRTFRIGLPPWKPTEYGFWWKAHRQQRMYVSGEGHLTSESVCPAHEYIHPEAVDLIEYWNAY